MCGKEEKMGVADGLLGLLVIGQHSLHSLEAGEQMVHSAKHVLASAFSANILFDRVLTNQGLALPLQGCRGAGRIRLIQFNSIEPRKGLMTSLFTDTSIEIT